MRRFVQSALLASTLATTFSGCTEAAPKPAPETLMVAEDVFKAAGTVALGPGDSIIINPETNPDVRNEFKAAIPLTVNERSRGFDDKTAPLVGSKPIRVFTDVYTTGDGHLNNDLACETVNIDLSRFTDTTGVLIGVLALGSSADNLVSVSWPRVGEDPAGFLQLCFADGKEPKDGVVIASDNFTG